MQNTPPARIGQTAPPDPARRPADNAKRAAYPPSQPPIAVDPDLLRAEIPIAMQEARRWVLWRNSPGPGFNAKSRKIPVYPDGTARTGKLDTPRDQQRLVTMEQALSALEGLPGYGLGFALGPSDTPGIEWQGIDLDAISQHPELTPLLDMAPGYKERSPSGDGYHIIGLGPHFNSLGSNKTGTEAYAGGRFFTVTGESIGGELADLAPFVNTILAPIHSQRPSGGDRAPTPAPVATTTSARPTEGTDRQMEDLRSALAHLSADDYDVWIKTGLRLKSLGQAGYELWDAWSQGSPKYNAEVMPGKWASFTPDRTGPKAIFADAQRMGWVNPASRAVRPGYNPVRQGERDGIFLEKGSIPFDTFDLMHSKASDPSGTPSGETCLPFDLASFKGKLLEEREIARGNTTTTTTVRIIESKAAEEIAKLLEGWLGLDRETGIWHSFKKSHWQGHEDDAEAVRIIAELVTVGTDWLGYRDSYLNGIVNILRKRALLAMKPPPPRTVPFLNGLLDLDTRKLTRARSDYAHRWVIPHNYDAKCRCHRFQQWLEEAVDNDLDTVEIIRAWMSAGLQGVFLQRVLIIHGWGGGGKSAFTTALEAVFGEYNIATTTLKSLEQNKFEMFKLVDKRLVQISEAGKHGGDINVLKMLSGGDAVPLEQKHKQQTKSFRYGGLLLIVSNDQLQTTDQTTGLERRRIQVSIKRVFSLEQYEEWRERGGVKAVLQSEPAGIVNWLLELNEEDIHQRIDRLSRRIVKDNLVASAANNAVVDWLIHCTKPVKWGGSLNDPAHIQIGGGGTKMENGMKVYLDSPDTRAFPNYLRYCDITRRKATNHRRFIDSIVEHCHRLGHPVKEGKHSVNRYTALFGLELVREGDEEFDWASLSNAPSDF